MTATRLIPPPVVRRLILSMLGWEFVAGGWSLGGQTLTEEAVDTMSPKAWEAFVGRWLVSAQN